MRDFNNDAEIEGGSIEADGVGFALCNGGHIHVRLYDKNDRLISEYIKDAKEMRGLLLDAWKMAADAEQFATENPEMLPANFSEQCSAVRSKTVGIGVNNDEICVVHLDGDLHPMTMMQFSEKSLDSFIDSLQDAKKKLLMRQSSAAREAGLLQ